MSQPSRPPGSEPTRLLSPARLAANRANAQRSTGPRSIAGRAASSRNSTRHGILARHPILPREDPAELEDLTRRLFEQLAPEPGLEELIVEDIVSLTWRLKRAARVEAGLFTAGLNAPALRALSEGGEVSSALGLAFAGQTATFGTLSRYETALVHRLRRAVADLVGLQAARSLSNLALVVIPGGA